jgi:hypothetical protein
MNNINDLNNDLKQSIRDLSDLYMALMNKQNDYYKNNLYKLSDINLYFILSINKLQYISFNLINNVNDIISPLCDDVLNDLDKINLNYSHWVSMALLHYKIDFGISATNIIEKNANAVKNAITIVTQLKDKFQDVAVKDEEQETTAGGSRMRRRMRKSRKSRKTRRS